jgi:hypothetical protein
MRRCRRGTLSRDVPAPVYCGGPLLRKGDTMAPAKKAASKKAAGKKTTAKKTAKARAAAVDKNLGKSQSLHGFLLGAGWR